MLNVLEAVNHPEHYQGVYSEVCADLFREHFGLNSEDLEMECIDFIEANDQYSDFLLGNAIKYLWRSGSKDDASTDLLKALWYLKRWKAPKRQPWKSLFFKAFGGSSARNNMEFAVLSLIRDLEKQIKLNP